MTRYQILFFVAVALLGYNAGFLLSNIQTRRAQKGWRDSLAANQHLIDVLDKARETMDQQYHAVEQLLAEKRARSGVTVPELDP